MPKTKDIKTPSNSFNLERAVKKRREKLGLTQLQLAKKLGYTNGQFVSNCERERVHFPVEKFRKLSKALKADMNKMIELRCQDQLEEIKSTLGLK